MKLATCFCEFGYLNFFVLPALNLYFAAHKEVLRLVTYPDYFALLQHLFGDRVEAAELLEQDPLRSGYTSRLYDERYTEMQKINVLLENYLSSLEERPDLHRVRQQTPFFSPAEATRDVDKRVQDLGIDEIVVFYLRNRTNTHLRNYQHDIDWPKFRRKGRLLVFIGDTDESLVPFPDSPTICRTQNLFENMAFFRPCALFVSNDSGIIDFAKNCGCREVHILPSEQEINPANFRPFGWCHTQEIKPDFLLPREIAE